MRLAEAEFNLTAQAMDQMSGQRSNHDARLRVQFGLFPEPDQEASVAAGRPIFRDAEYITIMVPGERDVVHRKAWRLDFERFPQQYAAFQQKRDQDAVSGTPLKAVTWLTQGQVKELEYFNCTTVEQLANMPDSTAQKFMQVNKLKQLAKDYLQAAKEAAPLTAMRAEMDKKDDQIAALSKQVADLAARTEEMMKAKK